MTMEIFRQRNESGVTFIDKYEITTVNKDKVYKDKARWGKWYSQELFTLADKLLSGDYSATAKVLNLPPQRVLGMRVKTEKWIATRYIDASLREEDYFKFVKFFGIHVPNLPALDETAVRLYNGFYFATEDKRVVKYGVKFDKDRLGILRSHIGAACKNQDNSELLRLINLLMEKGDYSAVSEIMRIAVKAAPCSCSETKCQEYYTGLKNCIQVEEYVSLSNAEFDEYTGFFNIDCPEIYVPVKPKKQVSEAEAPKAVVPPVALVTPEMLADFRVTQFREEMEKALAEGRTDDAEILQKNIDALIQCFQNGVMVPTEKQM